MKRYLICTLLVINAVPAQALDTMTWLGATVLAVGGTAGLLWNNQQNEEKAKKEPAGVSEAPVSLARARWCNGYTGCETVMSWADYITELAMASGERKKETGNDSNFTWIKAQTEGTIKKADLAIEDLKQKSNPLLIQQETSKLVALLAACEGNLEKCNEYGELVDMIQERLAASKKSAMELSQLNVQLATLRKDLSNSQAAIFEADKAQDLNKTLAAIQKYNLVAEKVEALINDIKTVNVNQGDSKEQQTNTTHSNDQTA